MNKEEIQNIINNCEDDIKYVEIIANDIVKSRTKDLDALMGEIQTEIVLKDNPSDDIIERYFLELTNALYFINTHCEYLGFYEDISKSNAKLKYNNNYSDYQISFTNNNQGKKATVNDCQIYAENSSINETMVSLIYSRAYKIIKSKIDGANEMVRTLSKVLSSHMQDKQLSQYSSQIVSNKVEF